MIMGVALITRQCAGVQVRQIGFFSNEAVAAALKWLHMSPG